MMTVLGLRKSYDAAMKIRSAEAAPSMGEQVPHAQNSVPRTLLEDLLSESPFVHLSLLDAAGRLMAEATRPLHATDDLARLRSVVHTLARTYPHAGLRRIFVQDDGGTVVLATLLEEQYLIAVADRSIQPGQASISVRKIAARLAVPPAPEQKLAPGS
jgi:hypothetical protein